ncbi:MAG: crossover junction endodeoxyribonuclease RuvC, partial [Selenomonadaceae bacterium]|nr:crossover junction endodeoxyribonuclease RuvC [Selenomonadaceae bacterium]
KLSVTGYGSADKHQVMFMIAKLLKLEEKIALDDTADALAVALAVANSKRF